MTEHKNINEFNTYLINNKINPNIIDYVKEVNKIKYNVDISFIDDFIELVSKDECCIHHNMLDKYETIKLKGAGSKDIKRMLLQYNLIEDEDYRVGKVADPVPQGGYITKNEYYLHPRAFKICLMRSKNEKKYAHYYILLEEAITYFNKYQVELNKKYVLKYKEKIDKQKEIIKEKDDNIINLRNDIQELIKKNEETSNEVKLLLKINKRLDKQSRILEDKLTDTNYKLDDVKDDLNDANIKLELTCHKLNITADKSVPEPFNRDKLEDFALLKSKNRKLPYRYYAIRAQTKYVNTKIDKMVTTKNYKELLRINNVANSINVWTT
jgi:hypothetical protein